MMLGLACLGYFSYYLKNRHTYTFGAHPKWTPVIALGYAASIWMHLFINIRLMQGLMR
jgi:hypothetical protein